MKIKAKNLYLYGIFALMFFWDILDQVFSNIQFVILLVLFIICLLQGNKFRFPKVLIVVALYILFQGIVNIFYGNDTIDLFIIQFVSILVCYIAYDTLIKKQKIIDIFCIYWKFAFIMSFFGLIEVVLGCLNNPALTNLPFVFTFTKYWYRVIGIVKLASLCREPSFLGYFLAPAVCLTLFKILAPELLDKDFTLIRKKFQCCCILFAYILTFSGVAYFGFAIMVIIIWWKKGISLKKLIIPIIAIMIIMIAYTFIPDIKVRIDDTLAIFVSGSENSNVNLSSFTYYANYIVVKNAVKNTFGLGSGLGSYRIMFDKYSIGAWGTSSLILNREDANSAFFRILTELGVVGIISVIIFLIYCMPKSKDKQLCYSCAIFSLLLMFLFRQGNYTHGGSVLFICLYIKLWKESKMANVMIEGDITDVK